MATHNEPVREGGGAGQRGEADGTPPKKPARLKDVAEFAGVSLKTVTNVVHERRYVKDETRARVKAAIAELGYTPSLVGRRLQSGRSNIVALAVPRIDEPYLGALAHALIVAGNERGYTVFIDETGMDDEQELQAASGYPGHGIDGVIYSPLAIDPGRVADLSRSTPMVLLGEHLSDGSADYVAIDNEQSARDVVRHLVAGGRRNIAYIGARPDRPLSIGHLRFRGYHTELARRGIPFRQEWTLEGTRFTRETGASLTAELLPSIGAIDALICASDLLAIGAIRTLIAHGVRVPEDVAVVGWDNTIDGTYLTPSLTSVSTDLRVLAEKSLDALIARIHGSQDPAQTHTVPHELIVRESSHSKSDPTGGETTGASRVAPRH